MRLCRAGKVFEVDWQLPGASLREVDEPDFALGMHGGCHSDSTI